MPHPLMCLEEIRVGESPAEQHKRDKLEAAWIRAAKSRLRLELQGLAFAVSRGATPQEYACFLWSCGAAAWMGADSADADRYLLKEAEAIATLYPWTRVEPGANTAERAVVLFSGGCLGGYGEDRWALARSLGLDRKTVCRYCSESFKVWARQLGLKAACHPQRDGTCKLRAAKLEGLPPCPAP